jgi:hypothetical protein
MRLINRRINGNGVTGQTVTIHDIAPEEDEVFVYTSIVARNSATGTSDWQVSIQRSGDQVTVGHAENITAGVPTLIRSTPVYVAFPDHLHVDITGTVDGDNLSWHLNGYIIPGLGEYFA